MDTAFAEYFQRQELSDADIVIRLRPENHATDQDIADTDAQGRAGHVPDQGRKKQKLEQLAIFPVHQVFLLKSDFFKAQVQHWTDCDKNNNNNNTVQSPASSYIRPTLQLTIDSKDHLPSAEAVIAAMYGAVEPLQKLNHKQLLAAALVADRVQVTPAVKLAVQLLTKAARSNNGLDTAAAEALACLYPWPACLLSLLPVVVQSAPCCASQLTDADRIRALDRGSRIERMLVSALGDLDDVWADDQLQQVLLQLPLPAMQLLLSSDQLRVASEDTVLYTAVEYGCRTAEPCLQDRDAPGTTATTALAPLIRCPHLSNFGLKLVTLAGSVGAATLLDTLHNDYDLQQLFSARCAAVAAGVSPADSLSAVLADLSVVPPSWRLHPRKLKPLQDGVRVQWQLPVEVLAEACRKSAEQQQMHSIESPVSLPLGGVAWCISIQCEPRITAAGKAAMIGAYAEMASSVSGVFYKLHVTLRCNRGPGMTGAISHDLVSPVVSCTTGYGDDDFFGTGALAGGWDEAVWVAKGLPTSGKLDLEMVLHNVW